MLLALTYIFAIPRFAGAVAHRVPAAATDRLSAEVLAILDRQVFAASEIPKTRQQELETAFGRLQLPSGASHADFRLVFRRSDALGSNAMALPSGTIVAAAPAALLEAKYSRELETEADLYAVRVLHANGIPPRHLGDILRRLDTESGHANAPGVLEYLSSHPATVERLERLNTN